MVLKISEVKTKVGVETLRPFYLSATLTAT